MKPILTLFLIAATPALPGFGQGAFLNLDFESARVVVNEPTFGFLDWNLAAPGWSHVGEGGSIYYGQEHLGLLGYYMLYDSVSPAYAPGTQLAGRYSLGFSSGYADPSGGRWEPYYIAQTGPIASDARSFRLLARGSFEVFVGGEPVPMQSLGGSLYAGDISRFAGTTAEFRIVNTATTVHTPLLIDNVDFSPVAIPEPAPWAWLGAGLLARLLRARHQVKPGR